MTAVDRLMAFVEPEPNTGCWIWTGSISPSGYGKFWHEGRTLRAHRAAHALLVGEIPAGKELDHRCRVRACVNPSHVEPVTGRENKQRSPAQLPTIFAAKNHCPAGHPYDDSNTYRRPNGGRGCKTCRRDAVNRYARRRREGEPR